MCRDCCGGCTWCHPNGVCNSGGARGDQRCWSMTNDPVRCGVHVDRIVFAEVSPGTVAANATWYQGLVGEEVVPLIIAGSIVLQAIDCEGGNYFRHWFELGSSVGCELK